MSSLNNELIGEGCYGKVVIEEYEGIEYAVKKYKNDGINNLAYNIPEVNWLMSARHPNIISCKELLCETYTEGNIPDLKFKIIMERGVPLSSIIHNLTFDQKLKYIHNICCGVHFITKMGWVHCDLKTLNIVIGDDDLAKIIDFGLVVQSNPYCRSITKLNCNVLTPEGSSLNKLEYDNCLISGEMWSLGDLILSIIYGVTTILSKINLKIQTTSYTSTLPDPKDQIKIFKFINDIRIKLYQDDNSSSMNELFRNVYGKYSSKFEPLIELIGQMHELDPNKRLIVLDEFIKHPLFINNNLHYVDIGHIIENEVKYDFYNFTTVTKFKGYEYAITLTCGWITEVVMELELTIPVLTTAIALFHRLVFKYVRSRNDIQPLSGICIMIASSLHQIGINVEDILIQMDGACNRCEFVDLMSIVINGENGIFRCASIYDIEISKKSFLMTLIGCIRADIYYKPHLRSFSAILSHAINVYPNIDDKNIFIFRDDLLGTDIQGDIMNLMEYIKDMDCEKTVFEEFHKYVLDFEN